MRFVHPSLLALAALLGAGGVRASPPRPASLSWARLEGADSCIGSLPLAQRVEQRLGRSLFVAPAQAQLAVEGYVAPLSGGSGWRAVIRVSDLGGRVIGERELRSAEPACASLDEPLLVVIGLLLEPDATVAPPSAPPPSAPPSAPPPSAPPSAPTPAAPTPAAPTPAAPTPAAPTPSAPTLVAPPPSGPTPSGPTRPPEPPGAWSASAAFVIEAGLLPGVAPGVTLRAERWWTGRGVTLGATVLRAAEARGQGGSGVLKLQRADLGFCPVAGVRGRAHLALCAGPGVGLWSSQGTNLLVDNDDRAVSLLLSAGGQARVKLVGALDAWASGQIETSLPRIRFSFEQSGGGRPVLFATPALAVSAALGVAGSWGS